MPRAGGILTPDELDRVNAALAWNNAIDPLTSCTSPVLTGSVLNLTSAADRSEVQAELQTLAAKLNEVIAALNLMKPE